MALHRNKRDTKIRSPKGLSGLTKHSAYLVCEGKQTEAYRMQNASRDHNDYQKGIQKQTAERDISCALLAFIETLAYLSC